MSTKLSEMTHTDRRGFLKGAGYVAMAFAIPMGEALAYDAAAVSPEGQPLMAAGPPRRVVVGRRSGESGLAVGGMISLASAGIATQGDGGRWLGPIEALTLVD